MLKQHPWWLFWLPSRFWITLSPNIYYPKGENPNYYPAIIAHESVHLKQQSSGNLLKWYLKYVFSRKFRLQMEAEAYAVEVKYQLEAFPWDPAFSDRVLVCAARSLAKWSYMWAAKSQEAAEAAIRAELAKLLAK